MTLVSNDPSSWPDNDTNRVATYVLVASSTAMIYDWALTFRQEVELVWGRGWSLITILYLIVRYVGILYSFNNILPSLPGFPMTDVGCTVFYLVQAGTYFVIYTILGIIMIARLNAMYHGSRKIHIFLIAIFPILTIASGLLAVLAIRHFSWDELAVSGVHQCAYEVQRNNQLELLIAGVWILRIVWEVLTLCLAVWIAVKHFHEVRWSSIGWSTGDCLKVLIITHVHYFVAFAAVSCFSLGGLSPKLMDSSSAGAQIYYGIIQIATFVQLFVLGPRLVISIREHYAKSMANFDAGTGMTPIAFLELAHVPTGGSGV